MVNKRIFFLHVNSISLSTVQSTGLIFIDPGLQASTFKMIGHRRFLEDTPPGQCSVTLLHFTLNFFFLRTTERARYYARFLEILSDSNTI